MRRIAITVIALAALIASCTATMPRGWVNLFQPPFDNCPSVMMALSCVSSEKCFIAGSGGQAFGVLSFDGRPNGRFESLNMPDMDMMIMALAAGGNATHPRGACGGMGFGDSVQYFVNATTLLPAQQPFLVLTQDIRAANNGSDVLVIDQGGSNSVLYSTNAGVNFTSYPITSLMPDNQTFSRYGAIANATTWFVTLGNWPESGSSSSASSNQTGSIALSPRRKLVKDPKTGKWKRVRIPRATVSEDTGYTCVIAKTTDGGNTWHNVMYEARNYYPNGIDCVGPTQCVAVGEGFNEKAGGHVWLTTDGLTFQNTLHLKDNSSGQFSLMSVKFRNNNEVWVGGSFETQSGSTGIFYYSQDGGQTWAPHNSFDFVGEITDISFTPQGVGFAAAVTTFDDSTLLRYDPTGPLPTPAPTWNGPFTQVSCSDSNCRQNCTTAKFQQNTCLNLTGGGSAIAQCNSGMLEQWVFPFSSNCTGLNEMQPMSCGVCLQNNGGGSFENYCGPVGQEMPGVKGEKLMRLKK